MTYSIVSLPINSISKIPQSSYYTKKFQVAAFSSLSFIQGVGYDGAAKCTGLSRGQRDQST